MATTVPLPPRTAAATAPASGASAAPGPARARRSASDPAPPTQRVLRGYAFDPSLATRLDTALISQITYRVPWEALAPGPVGEYVEVVDYDPASACFYAPVDLNHPSVLAQGGLAPSEGNPQFHQQMVYAVAMTTIDRFERALGRKAFWPDRYGRGDDERYVPRLRIYPHALRMANAYYSPNKAALLFGYFPSTEDRSSGEYPSGIVFTCLSHDVVAHETTHALLDGFHEHFMEATNADILAFHEAFADIVALFQHFTFPEVLAHQIAKTRGDLRAENLLAQLATQFGHARGTHGALRDAIGGVDPATKKWVKHEPDPSELERTSEVHARGAILVAAVFDAFLSIYSGRTRDLMRIASGGTGVLPQGELHPDLVARLAAEAAKSAGHVLNMCIRALDYCPPVDLTFGEYLRALITADMDLMPQDAHAYRVAFIEAFRRRGIYPDSVRTLSEDSLRWSEPWQDPALSAEHVESELAAFIEGIGLRGHIERLRYKKERKAIWAETRAIRKELHDVVRDVMYKADLLERITGLVLKPTSLPTTVKVNRAGTPTFSVDALREARREREDGRVLNQVFITILQKEDVVLPDGSELVVRCGSTLVVDLDEARIRYVIRKGLQDSQRIQRTVLYRDQSASSAGLCATYFGDPGEPFAALHRLGA